MTTAESFPYEGDNPLGSADIIPFPEQSIDKDEISAEERGYAEIRALMLGCNVVAQEIVTNDHEQRVKRNEEILARSLPPEARHSPQWFNLAER